MRTDGRTNSALREMKITPGYLRNAEGSCMIEVGNTRVICSASVDNGVPPFLRGKGRGWITAEYGMLPRSCSSRIQRESTKGKKVGRTHEIQRLIGRCARGVCDMNAIGERTIWLDCDVVEGDGGTRCASITGSFVALVLALNNMKEKKIIDNIPITRFVAAVSVGIVDGNICADLSYEEDSTAEVDMNVIMTEAGEFIEIQGTAEGKPFSRKDTDEMLDIAGKGIKKIIKMQKDVLKGII
jgi:ribonuclease PH